MIVNNYYHILKSNHSLIDLRSQFEFEKGSFPNAVNIPILNDYEREKVGKEFNNFGKNSAINLGKKLVSDSKKNKRINMWLDHLTEFPESILFCMRGGLRSQIAQEWLKENGRDVPLIFGGYKKLRNYCMLTLDTIEQKKQKWIIIGGRTGSGKTKLIKKISSSIDLENIANHKGSAFGSNITSQPSTINFENRLAIEFLNKESNEFLILEDESRSIGKRTIPEKWYQKMKNSQVYMLDTTFDDRVLNIRKEYVDEKIESNFSKELLRDSILTSLFKIKKKLGAVNFNEISNIILKAFSQDNIDQHDEWIKSLLNLYYDPMYDYQLLKKKERITFSGNFNEIKSKLDSKI